MYKPALVAGAIAGGLAVVLGAFGAHSLAEIATAEVVETFKTGTTYQMFASFLLLATGILHASHPFRATRIAAWAAMLGILLFSGSLYAITAIKVHGNADFLSIAGPLTPVGGLFFIVSWAALLIAILKKK